MQISWRQFLGSAPPMQTHRRRKFDDCDICSGANTTNGPLEADSGAATKSTRGRGRVRLGSRVSHSEGLVGQTTAITLPPPSQQPPPQCHSSANKKETFINPNQQSEYHGKTQGFE